jgi:hypothetical protein
MAEESTPRAEATEAPPPDAPPSPLDHPVYQALAPKQRMWVKAYLARTDRSATKAWLDSGLPGATPAVSASQMKKRVSAALAVLEPLQLAYDVWRLKHGPLAPELVGKPATFTPPTMTKEDAINILASLARGRDPRASDEAGKSQLVFRAADMLSAIKELAALKGWHAPSKLEVKPMLSDEARRARILELSARNAIPVNVLGARRGDESNGESKESEPHQ